MPKPQRNAFALVELVVVLLLGAVVLSLVPPLLLHARDSARGTACADHLRKVGQACRTFADMEDGVLPSNRRQPHAGWHTLILPHIQQEKLSSQYNFSQDWWDGANSKNRRLGRTRISTFLCPSAPHGDRWVKLKDPEGINFTAAPTDYVGSAGAYLNDNVPKNLYRGAFASPGRVYGGSGVTAGPAVRLSDITDGTSNTLLVVEMADKPNKWQAGRLAENKFDDENHPSLVPSFSFGQWIGPNWNHLRSHDATGQTPFGRCAVNCSNGGGIYSFHPKGANVAFADGSVRRLKAGLPQEILIALVSIADDEVLSPNDY